MSKAMTSPRTVVVMPPTKSRNSVFASLGGWAMDGYKMEPARDWSLWEFILQ